ncbi:hypothetical protein SHJG_7954 [Streptomyces hygroscopicus subsp. jinggangensis 5008]|nr:hypothetical protein SHJG_7954 [Streptomyces hygroscopicus subsp. jinggangensis 5008]AGF67378.1 hypothetical protein SHJGH_7716 [Streptomyces hygroscopicus subsp. jinggangensis TL01]
MAYGNAIDLDESTRIVPVFDPVLHTLSVQLWKGGQPAGIHGLVEHFTHPDDVHDTIDEFLEQSGVRALTEHEIDVLAAELITAKGGPDAALLMMARQNPESFLIY